MPKVMLTAHQTENDRLRKNLELIQGSLSNEKMGKIMGICAASYFNRKKNPEELKLAEVRRLCDYFHVSREDFVTKSLGIR